MTSRELLFSHMLLIDDVSQKIMYRKMKINTSLCRVAPQM